MLPHVRTCLVLLMAGIGWMSACAVGLAPERVPFALEYQGRAWEFEHRERGKWIQCDLPPDRVNPGPYPYVFQTPRSDEYFLLFSLVILNSDQRPANRVRILLNGEEVYRYEVPYVAGENNRIEIMPENPAIVGLGRLRGGIHSLEFSADAAGSVYMIHWGVADEPAMQEFWKRREPWLERRM